MERLPPEIITRIILEGDISSQMALMKVSQLFREILVNASLWRNTTIMWRASNGYVTPPTHTIRIEAKGGDGYKSRGVHEETVTQDDLIWILCRATKITSYGHLFYYGSGAEITGQCVCVVSVIPYVNSEVINGLARHFIWENTRGLKTMNLQQLDLGCEYLADVDWYSLAAIICKTKKVSLANAHIPVLCLRILFEFIAQDSDLILEDLDIAGIRPKYWPPTIEYEPIIQGIIKVKRINLSLSNMTKNFQNALWTHIGEQNHLVLEQISMWLVPLWQSDPVLLAKAAVKLKQFCLKKTQLTRNQLETLFFTIANEPTCELQWLNLDGNNLGFLCPLGVSSAITRIGIVHLEGRNFSLGQLTELINLILKKSEKGPYKLAKLFLPVYSREQYMNEGADMRQWDELISLMQDFPSKIFQPGLQNILVMPDPSLALNVDESLEVKSHQRHQSQAFTGPDFYYI